MLLPPFVLRGGNSLLSDISLNFLAICFEALPFMLVGSIAGGIIEVYVPRERMRFGEGRGRIASILVGGLLGLIFPVCECAIVVVIRRLLAKGIPLSAAIAFLLAGPIVNLVVTVSTAVAYRFDWTMVLTRLVCGYVIAVTVAAIIELFFSRKKALLPVWNLPMAEGCGCSGHEGKSSSRLAAAFSHACDDFFYVGRYLIIGAFVAAVVRASVSIELFYGLMNTPWLAILLMMGLAMALNLCSEADAFIAASFRAVLPQSAQMSFMVLGPMFDLKLIFMYMAVFRKPFIVVLSSLTFSLVAMLMLGLAYLGGW